MKIKDTVKDYDEVCAIKHAPHVKPKKQSVLLKLQSYVLFKWNKRKVNSEVKQNETLRSSSSMQGLRSLYGGK